MKNQKLLLYKMPYTIKKVKGGFKVEKKGGEKTSTGRRYFSDKPLTEEGAKSQIKALHASEGRKTISPTRKRLSSPRRCVKSPSRKYKPTSPGRKRKKQVSPKPKRRHSSPKYKRK